MAHTEMQNTDQTNKTNCHLSLNPVPNADRDLLMCSASFRRSPVASVLARRSDPARSTRLSFERTTAFFTVL